MDRPSLADVLVGGRLLGRLPAFLHRRITEGQARAALARRLERRTHDFLDLVRRAVYRNPRSPYRRLLTHAGCEYGDLLRLVRADGVEGALRALLREGVYLTVDEFKGRRPVVRGGITLEIDPSRLRNPCSAPHVPARTSGSRGAATPVTIDLAFIRDCASDTLLALHARGGAAWVKAHWQVPGGGAIARLIEYASFGQPPVRWFSQVHPAAEGLPVRYRWSARALRWSSQLAGRALPRPEHVPIDDPRPIASWMRGVLRAGQTPHLFTFASSAVRLCRAALDAGIDIAGAQLTVVGEPFTRARRAAIAESGATAVTRYAIIECSVIGQGCLAGEAPDDVHLMEDLHAVIQPDAGTPGGAGSAPLLLSSIRRTAPVVLLNVSMGDRAVVTRRACGCPLEALGWTRHLHTIQSDEKLTAEGMTFLDSDVVRVLEEVLPARFGGAPTDYQLLDGERGDGRARLRLLVHPSVGPLDPRAVVDTFLAAIGSNGAARVMARVWQDGALLEVERRPPLSGPSGKVLHLHTTRAAPPAPAGPGPGAR